jgi:hypothetical protein
MFYRSASLYHPQRRAILHLKNQKRKIKDKNKTQATNAVKLMKKCKKMYGKHAELKGFEQNYFTSVKAGLYTVRWI